MTYLQYRLQTHFIKRGELSAISKRRLPPRGVVKFLRKEKTSNERIP